MADRQPARATRSGESVRARVIRKLRAARRPLGTGELGRACAYENPRASAVTLTVLLGLEALRVVRRLEPGVPVNRGRPA